jgi:16S rRNA (cytosine1402-N4)-methyltransferase
MTAINPSGPRHLPVMPVEVLHWLAPEPGHILIDATAGAGGHSLLLAQRIAPNGRILVLDRDPVMLDLAKRTLTGQPAVFVQASFDQLRQVLDDQRIEAADGVLADLGICSDQLDDATRGFSFQQEGPLDMRMDPTSGEPASALLRRLNERELADVFYHYGEERFSRRVARRIVEVREKQPIRTTGELADLVRRCIPRPTGKGRRPGIDPATRVFQALRIAVNDELSALEGFLAMLPRCLKPGGRAVLISFHSLEDRRVKQAFRGGADWQVLTKKPIEASEEEVRTNPRARSAKLRAARRKGDSEGD